MLKRFRHTRGFGVHSPFGFEFVNRVINLKRIYTFYGYEQLRNLSSEINAGTPALHEAKLLLRLAAMQNPTGAKIVIDENNLKILFSESLRLANSQIYLDKEIEDAQLIIANFDLLEINSIIRILQRNDCTLYLRNLTPNNFKLLFDAMADGIAFEGKNSAIFCMRPATHKVNYKMP